MALSLLFFSAQFDIPYSILFVQVTLSHFSKLKIMVDMPLTMGRRLVKTIRFMNHVF